MAMAMAMELIEMQESRINSYFFIIILLIGSLFTLFGLLVIFFGEQTAMLISKIFLCVFMAILFLIMISIPAYAGIRYWQRIAIGNAEIIKKKREAETIIVHDKGNVVVSDSPGQWNNFIKSRPAAPPKAQPLALPMAEQEQEEQLLPIEDNIDISDVLIWGGRGAGKTNLAQILAVKYKGDVWVIDPKDFVPGKWQCKGVIGTNDKYDDIEKAFEYFNNLLSLRKQKIEPRHPTVILIDEITLLNMRIPKFSDMWLPIVLEGREYGLSVSVIGQSNTAGALGLKGNYVLLECFQGGIVNAKYDKKNKNRWVEVRIPGEPIERFAAPPLYQPIDTGIPIIQNPPQLESHPSQAIEYMPKQKIFDSVEKFVTDCQHEQDAEIQAGMLYAAYKEWCAMVGEKAVGMPIFGKRMREMFDVHSKSNKVFYKGITI